MVTRSTLMVCLLTLTALPAAAQIEWSDDPAEWDVIKEEQGKVSKGLIDFDDDPDYGVVAFAGPLTSEGVWPVSPGIVLDNVIIDTVAGADPTNLRAFGPSRGWGNPSNAILAGVFADALQIELTEPNHSMVMLNLLSLMGSYTVDVSFYDKQDRLIGTVDNIPAPAAGNPVLFWTEDPADSFGRITIFDPAGPDGGVEGIMQSEYWVPEPASLALLAVGALAAVRRRR